MIAPNSVGIIYNPESSRAPGIIESLKDILGLGENAWIVPAYSHAYPVIPDEIEMIITLGGDGTILWSTQIAAPREIPLLGINLGRVGFMTEIEPDDVEDKISLYLQDTTWIEQRSMLQVVVTPTDGDQVEDFHVLNEVVVGRNTITRLVNLDVKVDNIEFMSYRADALIVATATGSTGYALSAGGPLIHPESTDIITIPVAPHMNMGRAMVLPSRSNIEISVVSNTGAVVSLDGRIDISLDQDQVITVLKSPYSARFLRSRDQGRFYEMVNRKLKVNTDSF